MKTIQQNLPTLEIHLPADNRLDLARRIKARYPATMIAALTIYNIEKQQEAAKELGVEHMILQDDWTGGDKI